MSRSLVCQQYLDTIYNKVTASVSVLVIGVSLLDIIHSINQSPRSQVLLLDEMAGELSEGEDFAEEINGRGDSTTNNYGFYKRDKWLLNMRLKKNLKKK